MNPISPRSDLPEENLCAYLEQHIKGFRGPLYIEKFSGGQSNPSYLVSARSGNYVLRRKPFGKLLASAHAVDREFKVLRALHGSAVAVAQPIHLCVDERIIGTIFYVMQYMDGRIFWDPSLSELIPEQRTQIYESILQTLVHIHAAPIQTNGLAEFGQAGNYFSRQIKRWTEQYLASNTQDIPAMNALIEQLPIRCPADDGNVALVHGDFRIDNLMFNKNSECIIAVVDWELATLGHPLADLGYFCMALRLPRNPALPGLAGINRVELGIPSETQIVNRYAELSGRAIPTDWNFVLAFSFFRLASIAQGVAKRAEQGNASSAQAKQAGNMARLLAEMGLNVLHE